MVDLQALRKLAAEEVRELGVKFVPHSKSWSGWLGWCAERFSQWQGWRRRFWMTIGRTIHIPDDVVDPLAFPVTVLHELVHVRRQHGHLWWWLFRYVTSWRYRWHEERVAFLVDLRHGGRTVRDVAQDLRECYGVQLDEDEMRTWFERHLAAGDDPCT